MYEVTTDRADVGIRYLSVIVDADHPAGKSGITVGQVVDSVSTHSRLRGSTRHYDAGHRCGMGDGVIGIGDRQVAHGIAGNGIGAR